MEELTKQEEIEAIRQAQAEKLTPAQLKEELEWELIHKTLSKR